MKEVELDLSFVATNDLIKELQSREKEVIENAVTGINNYIKAINDFGVEVKHKSENIRLLPRFEIKTYTDKSISVVTYEDKEY